MMPSCCVTHLMLLLALLLAWTTAFVPMKPAARMPPSSLAIFMSTETPPSPSSQAQAQAPQQAATTNGYVPKWKKKKTLADEFGDDIDFKDKGIKGTISVVFKQGDEIKRTMAMPGQPLRDVATQAGQFIKYGCGKGECGTCEALCDGKWIRPCKDVVPVAATNGAEEIVIQVKAIASATTSSGTFFSVKSFFMGFYNNLLGMVGFVKYRRNAKQNWEERQEYEDLIKQRTLEKKRQKQLQLQKQKEQEQQNLGP
jgi:2Fe-2S iron-sulfur cluster binding domain